MNARYQKNTLPAGKTRKSAAASTPTRKGGGAATGSSSKSKKPARGAVRVDPPTPEFKGYRRQWWISLMTGMALVAVSFAIRTYGPKGASWTNIAGAITLVLAYVAIFYALYVDWAKMRPMRQAWAKSGSTALPEKPAKAEKAAAEKPDATASPKGQADASSDATSPDDES
jgi:hypothetical protein